LEFSKPGYVLQNNIPLLYSESITANFNPDDKMVKTLLLGVAGFSNGAGFVEFDVKGAIPLSGYEFDSAAFTLGHTTLTLGFAIAGQMTKAVGRITSSSSETNVDAPNSHTFKFTGAVLSRQGI
jgi:hypothetical protein